MNIKRDKSNALHRKAATLMPLGVNSNFRYWGDDSTLYVQKAKGSHLWDVDGNQYIDYRMAFGPIILGHAYDEVDAQVVGEIQKGLLFAMTSELEISVAEKIVAMCPGVEMVRLACSGRKRPCTRCAWRAHTLAEKRSSSLKGCITAFTITRFSRPIRQCPLMATATALSRFHPALASLNVSTS